MSSIRRACTVIVAAPKPITKHDPFDYKLLFVKRSSKSSFMPNAFVWPGGVCDKSDEQRRWPSLSRSRVTRFSDKICALRELFEETGLLLATESASKGNTPPSFIHSFIHSYQYNNISKDILQDFIKFHNWN
jgi:nucleoside diphosphate-linked moiety X motif protein 19